MDIERSNEWDLDDLFSEVESRDEEPVAYRVSIYDDKVEPKTTT